MINRTKFGVLAGAGAAGVCLAKVWKGRLNRAQTRHRMNRAFAGAMLVTAGAAMRWKATRRLSRKIGIDLLGRSLRLWRAF